MPEKLLTKKETAEYLGISEKEVEEFVAKGMLPAYKIGGTFLRFKLEHVDAVKNKASPFPRAASVKKPASSTVSGNIGLLDKIIDFFYFSDFYIISLLIIIILIVIIIYV